MEVPKERWDSRRFYDADPDKPGKMYTNQGGFLKDVLGIRMSPKRLAHHRPNGKQESQPELLEQEAERLPVSSPCAIEEILGAGSIRSTHGANSKRRATKGSIDVSLGSRFKFVSL